MINLEAMKDMAQKLSHIMYGENRVSKGTVDRFCQLLDETAKIYGYDLPDGYVYGDGDGGLRVEWENEGRELRLQLWNDHPELDYLYHQEGADTDISSQVTPHRLSMWLSWACQRADTPAEEDDHDLSSL